MIFKFWECDFDDELAGIVFALLRKCEYLGIIHQSVRV
jgi:hypothetical protein